MAAKAIVFGVGGQDGFYLTELLRSEQVEVVGVSRSAGADVQGSVADRSLVDALVKLHRPDYVFHLAANSTTQHGALFENHETISTGALVLLEAAHTHSRGSRVFLSGSAMQFANRGQPIDEAADWCASSPYAIARIQTVYAARYYRSLGLQTYVGYFFNHDSPRRTERHMTQKIARAARRIADGSAEKLEIGNLEVRKEYTFAGDAVRAAWTLVNNECGVGEAIIGSGEAHSIREWVELCFARVGADWRGRVTVKPGFKPEYDILVSNPALIRSLGWEPRVSLEELARMMTT